MSVDFVTCPIRHGPDRCSHRARDAPSATCGASNSHAGAPFIHLRRRPSRPCGRPPDGSVRRRERSAVGPRAFAHSGTALCSSARARWRAGAQALREALQSAQRQVEHALEAQQCLDQRVAVEARAPTLRFGAGCPRRCGFIDPHRDLTSVDLAGVAGRPVPDAVARLRLARPAPVPAHIRGKNRESTQVPELLTATPRQLLRTYVNKLRSRRFYATTPGSTPFSSAHVQSIVEFDAHHDKDGGQLFDVFRQIRRLFCNQKTSSSFRGCRPTMKI